VRHSRIMVAFTAFATVLLMVAYVDRPQESRPSGRPASAVAAVAGNTPGALVTPPASTPAGPGPAGGQWPAYNGTYEWPLPKLNATSLWARSHEGAGITVAVVDTGVDAGHPDLAGAVAEPGPAIPGVPGDQSPDSHGTEIAGIIAGRGSAGSPAIMPGLAPRARLLDIRVTNDEHQVNAAEIAAGIKAAVAAGARVINVSLGTAQDSKTLDQAVADAVKQGRLVVAGVSEGGKAALYPADSNGALAVAGIGTDVKPDGSLAAHGPYAVYAPGSGLYSTSKSGYTAHLKGNGYAAAYVSAAAALLWSADPDLTEGQVRDALVGKVTSGNFNVLNPLPYLEAHGFPVTGPSAPVPSAPGTSAPATPATTKPGSAAPSSAGRSPASPPAGLGLARLALLGAAGFAVAVVVALLVMAFLTRRKPDPPGWDDENIPLDLDMEPL
jgi:subtilisin family serine protease